MRFALCLGLALFALAQQLPAQTVTVDYPDSVLGSPAGQYPIYTGTVGNVVRGQIFCPATFANFPTQPMRCIKVGVQLSGQENYQVFRVRAGTSSITALSASWATNLPDQRVQVDLSGTTLVGGSGVNQWIEWDLANPFIWSPGEAIVIDITAQTAVAGVYCRTAIGSGVPRCINTNFTGQPGGSALSSGGIKFRMVLEPPYVNRLGNGCPDASGRALQMTYAGSPLLGQTIEFGTSSASIPFALLIGVSDQMWLGGIQLPIDLTPLGASGCSIYVSQEVLIGGVTAGTRLPLPIPSTPYLLGAVAYLQGLVVDGAIPQPFPVATSDYLEVTVAQ